MTGQELLGELKSHVLETMKALEECEPGVGRGLGYRAIEQSADLDLGLAGHDGYLTWSLMISLVEDGWVEVVPGTERRRRFRLVSN